jgi:uncharacterized protein YdaU (DUF1376 family)
MHYYQHNIGDYRKDTSHLSLLEHGIYRQLLDSYYLDEIPLSNDLAKLMRSHSVRTAEEQQSLQNVLTDFFELTEFGYIHKRCEDGIAKFHGKSASARASAMARWSSKHKEIDANAIPTQSKGNANHKPITNNQEPLTINQDIKPIYAESKIPPCPHQAIIDIYHQTLPELPKVISWNKTREAHLKQRWRELFTEFECKSTEEALDWFKNDFFQFIKNSKFLTGRTQSKDRRPFLADLEWVIKPTNFTKIIERKYL